MRNIVTLKLNLRLTGRAEVKKIKHFRGKIFRHQKLHNKSEVAVYLASKQTQPACTISHILSGERDNSGDETVDSSLTKAQ